jgi:tRNA threonylcarbamoyladenosine biosynthesis protein TsaB
MALHLALETSGRLGSVAVGLPGEVRAEARLEVPGNHAAELIARIESTLSEARVGRDELAGIVVGSGPGSFTGVRIAAATAKGLAHALSLPLRAFSSLEAAALAAPPEPSTRFVLFDARGDRVYAACYRVGAEIETAIPPHATSIGELLDDDLPAEAQFMGTGATRHRAALEAAARTVLDEPAGVPTAAALLRLLALHPGRAPIAASDPWEPEYVKESSARRPRVG